MKYFFKAMLTVSILLLAAGALEAQVQPVVLTTPGPESAGPSSITLQWEETTTPDAEFSCYKVYRSTSAGSVYIAPVSVPAVGAAGILALIFLLLLAGYGKGRALASMAVILIIAGSGWVYAYSNPWISNCISPKSTITYTDTGLAPGTTYYYQTYVFATDGSYLGSNEVSTTTTSVSLGGWLPTGSLPHSTIIGEAFLLSDGKVLSYSAGFRKLQIYDPGTGQWSSTTGPPPANFPPYCKVCRFPGTDRFIFVADYYDAFSSGGFTETMIYDYTTGSWAETGSYGTPRLYFAIACLQDGRALIAGGYNGKTARGIFNSAEIYNPATGSWSYTGSMDYIRANFTTQVLNDGKVLVAGGSGDYPHIDQSAEIYDPVTGTWSFTGSMNFGRVDLESVLLSDGKVMVAGGYINNWKNDPSNSGHTTTAEVYDPATGRWSLTGAMNDKRSLHSLVKLSDGRVMATGGYFQIEKYVPGNWLFVQGQVFLNTVDIYSPSTGTWSATPPMPTVRHRQFGVLLQDGRILAGGGQREIVENYLNSSEIFTPNFTN